MNCVNIRMHGATIKITYYQVFLFYPIDSQLDCSKRMSKFTLKCSYMFRFNNHHQGATTRALLKL